MRLGELVYEYIEEKQRTENVSRLCIADPVSERSWLAIMLWLAAIA